MGYTGDDINIGLLEVATPLEISTIKDSVIYVNEGSTDPYYVGHATSMAEIIVGQNDNYVGAAPNATLFCAGIETSVIDSIEKLMERNINILSISLEFEQPNYSNLNVYGFYSQYLDYLVYRYNVTICKGAGNYRGFLGVQDGGMSYNSIVVGNIDDQNTLSLNDDIIYSSSLYTSGADVAYKPDLCAPGERVGHPLIPNGAENGGGGTSSATAVVSGTCALLMQANPQLIGKPMLMKAILMSSATRVPNMDSVFSTTTNVAPAISRIYGAGMINATRAFSLATDSDSWLYIDNSEVLNSDTEYIMSIPVSQNAVNRSKKIAICLSWTKKVVFDSSLNQTIYRDYYHTLELYDPDGNRVAYSVNIYDTKAFIYYEPTVSGTYQVRVQKSGGGDNGGAPTAMAYTLIS